MSNDTVQVLLKFGHGLDWTSLGLSADELFKLTVPREATISNLKEMLSMLCDGALRANQMQLRFAGNPAELTDCFEGAVASTSNRQPRLCTIEDHGVLDGATLELDVLLTEDEAGMYAASPNDASEGPSLTEGPTAGDRRETAPLQAARAAGARAATQHQAPQAEKDGRARLRPAMASDKNQSDAHQHRDRAAAAAEDGVEDHEEDFHDCQEVVGDGDDEIKDDDDDEVTGTEREERNGAVRGRGKRRLPDSLRAPRPDASPTRQTKRNRIVDGVEGSGVGTSGRPAPPPPQQVRNPQAQAPQPRPPAQEQHALVPWPQPQPPQAQAPQPQPQRRQAPQAQAQTQQPQPRQPHAQAEPPRPQALTQGQRWGGRKQPWTVPEVTQFVDAMEKYGKSWSIISRETGLRDQVVLKDKWRNICQAMDRNWESGRTQDAYPPHLRRRIEALRQQLS